MDDPTPQSAQSSTSSQDQTTSAPEVAGRIGTETSAPADPPKDSDKPSPTPSPLTGATLASGEKTDPRPQTPLKDSAVLKTAEPDSAERQLAADREAKYAANRRPSPSSLKPAP